MRVSEQCPTCYGTGKYGSNGLETCPKCHGFGEIDPEPPRCKSCGSTWIDHIGTEGTCKQLQEATRRIAELESNNVRLTKALAEKQEQLDQLAHKALELEAENKRFRDLAKSVVRYTGTRLEDDEKERLRSEILNTAMNLLLKPEPLKEQKNGKPYARQP